jgi:hypothetical protein
MIKMKGFASRRRERLKKEVRKKTLHELKLEDGNCQDPPWPPPGPGLSFPSFKAP